MTIRALGNESVVEFDGREVAIERRGQAWSRQPAQVSVPIEDVVGFNTTPPGRTAGAFQLVLGAFAARYEPPVITYPAFRARDFARLAEEIAAALMRRGRSPIVSVIAYPAQVAPAEPVAPQLPPGSAPEQNVVAQLAALGEQYRDGLLTAREFSAAKARLLGLDGAEPTDRAA